MTNQLQNDICVYRSAVAVLDLAVIGSLMSAIWLALTDQSTPEIRAAVALGSAAFAGFMALAPLNR